MRGWEEEGRQRRGGDKQHTREWERSCLLKEALTSHFQWAIPSPGCHFPFLALCALCYITPTFGKRFPGSNIRYCFYTRQHWSSGCIHKAGCECAVIWSWIFLFSSQGAFGMLNSERGRAAVGFRIPQL